MNRMVLGTIIVVALLVVGCRDGVPNSRLESTENSIKTLSSSPASNQINYVETFEGESHKQIQYGKLLLDIGDYHILSQTKSENKESFKCEIDKGENLSETSMTIKISEIEVRNLLDTESVIAFLSDMVPDYENIRIYNKIVDDSGIICLYSVTGGGRTNYIVYYKDACYLVESDYNILDVYLFKNDPEANYEVGKFSIECGESFISTIVETIYYSHNEFKRKEYSITQGKNKVKYSAVLSYDTEYDFILNNENGDNLLKLSTYGDLYAVIKFLDVNMDGYVDIQFLEQEGAFNNSYALYVWADSAKKFVKAISKEMLSEIEVHDGYLINRLKESADTGVMQKLVWDKETLEKVSEEHYKSD